MAKQAIFLQDILWESCSKFDSEQCSLITTCQNINILAVMNVAKNDFSFPSNQETQGHKHQSNNCVCVRDHMPFCIALLLCCLSKWTKNSDGCLCYYITSNCFSMATAKFACNEKIPGSLGLR